MKNKLLITTALAGSLIAGSALAQTTITGSLDLTYNAVSKDLIATNARGDSTRGVGRESQINIQNKGKLNVGGLDYAAGFALEFDGTGTGSPDVNANDTGKSVHNENVYVDIISGNTTFTIGVDHIQRGYAGAAPAIVNITDQMAGAGSSTTFVIGARTSESAGLGIMQNIPGTGIRASYFYAPRSGDTGTGDMNAQAANLGSNSSYEVGINGTDTFGVKGLTVQAFKNKADKSRDEFGGAIKGTTYGIGYNFGQFAVGIDRLIDENNNLVAASNTDAFGERVGVDFERDTQKIGITFAASKDLTIGLVQTKTDVTGAAAGSTLNGTEKVQAIQVGYSLGPVALTLTHAKFDDLMGRAGTLEDDNGTLSVARLSTRF